MKVQTLLCKHGFFEKVELVKLSTCDFGRLNAKKRDFGLVSIHYCIIS